MIGHEICAVIYYRIVAQHLKYTYAYDVVYKITVVRAGYSFLHVFVSSVYAAAAGNLKRSVIFCKLTANKARYVVKKLI